MYAKFMILALLGLSHFTCAGAITNRAAIARTASSASSASSSSPTSSPASSSALAFSGANLVSSLATVSFTTPFPLTSGATGFPFPNTAPSDSQISAIEDQALGVLPSAQPDSNQIFYDPTVSLAALAFLELFEVAFFNDLLNKLVNKAHGFREVDNSSNMSANHITNVTNRIVAQEELHYLSVLDALPDYVQSQIQSCAYWLDYTSLGAQMNDAAVIIGIVLSTLPDIQTGFAQTNSNLIAPIGSIIGEEGEQAGFFREYLNKNGPQLPFLTGGAMAFGFNAVLQRYVNQKSCNLSVVTDMPRGVPRFANLWAVTPSDNGLVTYFPGVDNGTSTGNKTSRGTGTAVTSEASADNGTFEIHYRYDGMRVDNPYITYMNQQTPPVTVPCRNSTRSTLDNANACVAHLPSNFNGLTIVVVTSSKGPFTRPADVVQDTLAGPLMQELGKLY